MNRSKPVFNIICVKEISQYIIELGLDVEISIEKGHGGGAVGFSVCLSRGI